MKKNQKLPLEQPVIFPQIVNDGLQVILYFSSNTLGTVFTSKDLARGVELKGKRLGDVLRLLVKAKMLASRGGGYLLRRSPHSLTLFDAVNVLMGGFTLRPCQRNSRLCSRSHACAFRPFWNEMRREMERRMSGQNFGALARNGFWKGAVPWR